jgi:hypothetical protein
MMQFAFLLAVIFGGIAVITPIVGLTIYLILRPWSKAYAARQHALAVSEAYERGEQLYAARQHALEASEVYERGGQR